MRFHSQLLFKLTSEKGIYPGQAVCLWFISKIQVSVNESLAEKIRSTPTVTLMLQKLEKAGLVIRKEDERDQRLSHTYLTNAGVDTLNVLNSILAEIINTSLENLSHDEQRNLIRLLDIINSNIERKL